jgi:RNA chaperone Hfq
MARAKYLQQLQDNKTHVKIFLTSGTMLQGKIMDYDEECLVIDKCLAFYDQIISVKYD